MTKSTHHHILIIIVILAVGEFFWDHKYWTAGGASFVHMVETTSFAPRDEALKRNMDVKTDVVTASIELNQTTEPHRVSTDKHTEKGQATSDVVPTQESIDNFILSHAVTAAKDTTVVGNDKTLEPELVATSANETYASSTKQVSDEPASAAQVEQEDVAQKSKENVEVTGASTDTAGKAALERSQTTDGAAASASKSLNVLFILVGAVRTWEKTQRSVWKNLIRPLCDPEDGCVAHVVTHFSSTDNRPDVDSNSPFGQSIEASTNETTGEDDMLQVPTGWPVSQVKLYEVPPYNIASEEESMAMDQIEQDCLDLKNYTGCSSVVDFNVTERIRLLRYGDPRRYSMWFARAYAWAFAKQTIDIDSLDGIFFTRPDMHWMLPTPGFEWFRDFSNRSKQENIPKGVAPWSDIFVHDSYFSHVPDTWAFMFNEGSADWYFDLPHLVKPDVACLGGPNFNQTLISSRLVEKGITLHEEKPDQVWCEYEYRGWSEYILKQRLNGAITHIMPMSSTILRPQTDNPSKNNGREFLLCVALEAIRLNGFAQYAKSHVPVFNCLLNDLDLAIHWLEDEEGRHHMEWTYPYRLKSGNESCLALTEWNATHQQMEMQPCRFPFPPQHMFAGDLGRNMTFGFTNKTGTSTDALIHITNANIEMDENTWTKEYLMPQQYEPAAFRPVAHKCSDKFCSPDDFDRR